MDNRNMPHLAGFLVPISLLGPGPQPLPMASRGYRHNVPKGEATSCI